MTHAADIPAWKLGARSLTLDRPRLMGILNITPDSFFDGGKLTDSGAAQAAALAMARDGASILDVGGESTRPGSEPVAPEEQLRRVIPVIHALRSERELDALAITVDTTRREVAHAALDAGADGINDVSGGTDDPAIFALAADRACGLVLMHRVTTPRNDRYSDQYQSAPITHDATRTVALWLNTRVSHAFRCGVAREAIVIDPGLGFGKSVEQNLELIRRSDELAREVHRLPILSGVSRKSFAGRVSLGRDSLPSERLAGTLALSVLHLAHGARIFRVHDVREHAEALQAAWQLLHPAAR